jgi:hypothetical protein
MQQHQQIYVLLGIAGISLALTILITYKMNKNMSHQEKVLKSIEQGLIKDARKALEDKDKPKKKRRTMQEFFEMADEIENDNEDDEDDKTSEVSFLSPEEVKKKRKATSDK